MSKRTLCTTGIIIFSLIIALFTAPYVNAAETGDRDLLTVLPGDSVFCVRINDFTGSLGKLDQYLAGVSPMPISLAMLVNMQLGAAIGDPMLTGIDQGGDFAIFAIPPQGDEMEPVAGMLIPVTDFKTFVQTNPNCKKGENGIVILSVPNSPMGSFALTEAGGGKYALVVPDFEMATLTPLQKALADDSKLTKRLSAAQVQNATTAPAWAYVNLAVLYEKYNEDALTALETAQQEMNRELQVAPGGMAGVTEVMDFYFEMLPEILEKFGGAMDSATISLIPEPTILNLDIALRAKDGSELAEVFIKNPKANGNYSMTGYLDNNNAINAMAKMNMPSTEKMYDMIFEIIDEAADDSKFKEKLEDFRESLEKSYDAMGDEVSLSFSYAGGYPLFRMQEVIEVKQPEMMEGYMENTLDFVNEMYKSMGFPIALKYQASVSTYKNATIDILSIVATESDDPNMTSIQQEIEKVYGQDGLKYYFAHSPDKFYMVMGPDGENALKALIDQPASAAPSGDIKIAIEALKNTPYNDFVCSINVIKLMKGMGEMMGTMAQPGMGSVAEIFSGMKDVQTQSCLVTGGSVADGQVALRLAIPKQHLLEIVTAAMQLQQQAMAGMQPQMQDTPSDSAVAPKPQQTPLSDWIGKPAPELKMTDLDGEAHRISRLKGKKIALDFWATWCPPCKKAIPDLIKLAGSGDSDLVVLGLSDESADTLAAFVKEAKINYPIIRHGDDLPEPYSKVTAIPTMFLIDSKGIIRDVLVGYHPLEDLQERLKAMN